MAITSQNPTKFSPSLLNKLHITSITAVEKTFFVQNLLTMLKAGFALTDALNTLSQQTKKKEFQTIILELKKQIEQGGSLSAGLKKYPHVFSELFIHLIEAGEISGKLEETLYYLLIQMKKGNILRKKIRNALIYPMIILAAMVILGIGMMVFVLPNLINLYSESQFVLPLPTRITLAIAGFILQNGWIVGTIIFVIAVLFFVAINQKQGKYYWHFVVLKIPIISHIIQIINLAKLSRVLNSLLAADLPIARSFEIISQTLGNRVYRQYLQKAKLDLTKGKAIYGIFRDRPDLFPPLIAQMVHIGEQSGTLEDITQELAEFYEEEVSDTMANLTVIIEPLLMLVVGSGVAFLAVSVIYPIYALVNQI